MLCVAPGQVALELGDRRVLAHQPLPDRAGPLVWLIASAGWPVSLRTLPIFVARSQVALEGGDRRFSAASRSRDHAGLFE